MTPSPSQTAAAAATMPERETPARFAPARVALAVWGVAAFFYLVVFYVRMFPAVMTTELMRDFDIAALQLGNLSAFYFYAYVLMQIPTGVLVDSWGARRLLVGGSFLAAIGCVIFGTTDNFGVAAAGRAITGAATAVGWVVTLKLATHWFPQRRFATLSGVGLMIGTLGALVAQVPLRLMVEQFGWRAVSVASGGAIVLLAIVAWVVVRDDPSERGYESHAPAAVHRSHIPLRQLLAGFKDIFRYRNTWLIFIAQGGFVGGILAFAGLWGVPFLRVRYDVPLTTAAAVTSVMMVCFAAGSPISGYLSDRIGARKPVYLAGVLTAATGWLVLFYLPGLSLPLFIAVGAVTAFASGANVLAFAYAKESVPARFLGTISGAINVGNMLGPTLLQPGIGWLLDLQWGGQAREGVRVYHPSDYQTAFLLVVGWCLLSCVLIALTRDTGCKQTT